MYMVVSYWEPLPGREAEFDESDLKVPAILRDQPGIIPRPRQRPSFLSSPVA